MTISKILNAYHPRDKGETTGRTQPCPIPNCGGTEYEIVWPDATVTWVCDSHLIPVDMQRGIWQIHPHHQPKRRRN